jgi:hypothetical protein
MPASDPLPNTRFMSGDAGAEALPVASTPITRLLATATSPTRRIFIFVVRIMVAALLEIKRRHAIAPSGVNPQPADVAAPRARRKRPEVRRSADR